jgi:hypothetical protein
MFEHLKLETRTIKQVYSLNIKHFVEHANPSNKIITNPHKPLPTSHLPPTMQPQTNITTTLSITLYYPCRLAHALRRWVGGQIERHESMKVAVKSLVNWAVFPCWTVWALPNRLCTYAAWGRSCLTTPSIDLGVEAVERPGRVLCRLEVVETRSRRWDFAGISLSSRWRN